MSIPAVARLIVVLFTSMVIFGCGGGGDSTPVTTAGPAATKAVLVVSLQGTLASGTSIGAVDITVNLPTGVTAQADAASGETLPAVVVPSGNAAGSTSFAKFTAATATTQGSVRIGIINTTGFAAGELVTLNLDITGAAPAISGFGTTSLVVTDVNGTAVSGMAAALTLQLI